jgi:hypothetical protein
MELMPPIRRRKPMQMGQFAPGFKLNLEEEPDVLENPVNFTEGAALSPPQPQTSMNYAAPPLAGDSLHLSGGGGMSQQKTSPDEVSAPVFRGGFENYMDTELQRTGGTLVLDGKSRKRGARFSDGRFKGMTLDEARDTLRTEYAGMSDDQRMKWENRAYMRDVRSKREQDLLSRPEYRRGGFI